MNNPRQPQHQRDSQGHTPPNEEWGVFLIIVLLIAFSIAVIAGAGVGLYWIHAFGGMP